MPRLRARDVKLDVQAGPVRPRPVQLPRVQHPRQKRAAGAEARAAAVARQQPRRLAGLGARQDADRVGGHRRRQQHARRAIELHALQEEVSMCSSGARDWH